MSPMKSVSFIVALVLMVAASAQASGRGYQQEQLASQAGQARIGAGRSGGLAVATRPASHYRNDGINVVAYVKAIDNALVSTGAELPKLSAPAKAELYLSVVGTDPQVDSVTIDSVSAGLEITPIQAETVITAVAQ